MHFQSLKSVHLRFLSFHLLDIELVTCPTGIVLAEEITEAYTLLICKNGSGKMYDDNQTSLFSRHSAFLFNPGAFYQFKSSDEQAFQFFKIKFIITHIDESNAPKSYKENLFPGRSELRVYPLSQLIDMAEQLYESRQVQEEMESFQHNLRFLKMMGFVLEQNMVSESKPSSVQSVERTIQYLQDHYTDKITVKLLSQMAGLPNVQYSAIFKEVTGKKPLDYLTELRIKQSKDWLLQSNESLRHIAERVGFTDEYYFNRRFRKTTGMSPRQYAIAMRRRVSVRDWAGHEVSIPAKPTRIIFYGNTIEDLLTLGIQPIGGDTIWGQGHPFNTEQATSLKPDLIIFDREDEREYEQISQIAPTLTYNSFGSIEQRLLTLGEWFGKELEAKHWLNHYASNAELMWKQLEPHIRPGETASVFVHHRGKRLFVMGNIGLTTVLYHPYGFSPTKKVEEVLNEEQAYKEITVDTLQDYAGDRIFMLLPSSTESRRAMEETISSPLWQCLPAVRNGLVYLVDEDTWNCCDANTINKLLSMLPRLLRHTS